MTTTVNIPFEDYTADGVQDTFAFTYPIIENLDQLVFMDIFDGRVWCFSMSSANTLLKT